ncbi:MAG: hypothetical protein K2Y01_04350 [Rhabdochlamydiaceae bacterium]|nr:hypothetical protein [Rhabdochlamydiaceae bacterium]
MNILSNRFIETFSGAREQRVVAKRRKIEAHFQKLENITGAAFTIASEEIKEGVVGGYFLRLNAKAPYKPLAQACEGYCLDTVHSHLLSPVLYALSSLYSLYLTHVPVSFYVVSEKLLEKCQQILEKDRDLKDPIEVAIRLLLLSLPKVEFSPCFKGPFFEKMQSKLYLAKNRNREDVQSLDFAVIANHLLQEEIVL